jgi:hypothetical protein
MPKTIEERTSECVTLMSQITNLGIKHLESIKDLSLMMNHYIRTGTSYCGQMFIPEINKNLYYDITNQSNKICNITLKSPHTSENSFIL